MKKRRVILVVLAGIVAAGVVAVVWPREREPEYKGKRLREWIVKYQAAPVGSSPRDEAADAVRHIGTNALPWLLQWMRYELPQWRRNLAGVAFKMAFFRRPNMAAMLVGQGLFRVGYARLGFEILGPEGAPAVTELTRLMSDFTSLPVSGSVSGRAMYSLRCLGDDGVPPLMTVFTNQTLPAQWRYMAGQSMTSMAHPGSKASAAVPQIVECLIKETNRIVARCAVEVLGGWAIEPGVAVPALIDTIPDPTIGMNAILALENFGGKGRAAVPVLIRTLNDPDDSMRRSATNALRKIAPEVLGEAGRESGSEVLEGRVAK